ncbi:SpoIIE family protein phosphatase [Amycolatopsis sp. NBC_00438]|uniref:SpoIIE family protein phosphatase n=1 Tax=Amycolatopsis sp. NBC_00438 TaxID=2903558 RepID=UPI002E209ECA
MSRPRDRALGDDQPPAASIEADLRSLFGQSPAVFASLAGPDHVLEAANPAFFDAVARADVTSLGVPLGRALPELAGQGFLSLLDRVYRTGEPATGRDARVLLGPGPDAREAFFDFTYEPRRDASGAVTGVRVIGVETTQAKHAQRLTAEHRALLEQIARQAPLERILDGMARAIEELAPDVLVSVLLADPDGRHLRHGAAPSLPKFYNNAIDGIATGEGVGSCGTAAHRRRPVIVTDIANDPFWDDFRELAGRAGLAACWSTPILGRDERLLGTFAMYHRAPRSPQDADFALTRLFADTAALAIERHHVELARQAAEAKEKAARQDLAFLLSASTALSADLDHVQALQRLAELCVPGLAPLCTVDIVEDGRVRRAGSAGANARATGLLDGHRPAPRTDSALGRVLASGMTEVARQPPLTPGPWRELGVTGYLCVPLTERGQTFGVLTLLSTGEGGFDGHTVSLAEEVALRAASAARNARQYSQRVTLARDLQAGLLLPDLPAVPGAELATFYHPAGEGLDIGGDFYDVFPLDDRTWAFMLGDVCGRGAKAATTTALVRHTARAVAPLLGDPVAILQAVDRALSNRPDAHGTDFVTMVYGHLTPGDDGLAIDLLRAGHNLPLVLDSAHRAHELDIPGKLLGLGGNPRLEKRHLVLKPDESLVLLTDGFVETRNPQGEQFGDDRLLDAVTSTPARPGAHDVLDAVTAAVRAFAQAETGTDDQAALVITARPAFTAGDRGPAGPGRRSVRP